jgi:hypothetical protein
MRPEAAKKECGYQELKARARAKKRGAADPTPPNRSKRKETGIMMTEEGGKQSRCHETRQMDRSGQWRPT